MVFANSHCVNTQSMKVLFAQSCPALRDPMDYSLPGSSVHGILQERILEWISIPFSRASSGPRIELGSPALQADYLPSEPTYVSQFQAANVKLQNPALGRDPHKRVGRVSGLHRGVAEPRAPLEPRNQGRNDLKGAWWVSPRRKPTALCHFQRDKQHTPRLFLKSLRLTVFKCCIHWAS